MDARTYARDVNWNGTGVGIQTQRPNSLYPNTFMGGFSLGLSFVWHRTIMGSVKRPYQGMAQKA